MTKNLVSSDYVQTPEWCAMDMIRFYGPCGKILDPCRGENKIFWSLLTQYISDYYKNCQLDWNEISEDKDFFNNDDYYNWIIGNPPYSIFKEWMKHSYEIASNIVYLLPTFKIFNALNMVRMYQKYGWIKHIRIYDVGKKIEWARSRPIVAAWWQRGYNGETSWSIYDDKK